MSLPDAPAEMLRLLWVAARVKSGSSTVIAVDVDAAKFVSPE